MRLPLALIALLIADRPAFAGDDVIEAKVLAAGGTVTRNPIFKLGRPIQEVWLGRSENGDELLESLTTCARLTRLRLNGSSVTNEGLAVLPRFTSLVELDLVDTRITDDGMATYALIIQDSETWSDARQLAESVAADPPVPILRGERK